MNSVRDSVNFFSHLVNICMYSDQMVRDRSWLLKLTKTLPTAQRCKLIRRIGCELEKLDEEATDEVWTRWINSYWEDRLNSIPDKLDIAEAGSANPEILDDIVNRAIELGDIGA